MSVRKAGTISIPGVYVGMGDKLTLTSPLSGDIGPLGPVPRSRVYRMLRTGEVRVNGRRVNIPSFQVRPDQILVGADAHHGDAAETAVLEGRRGAHAGSLRGWNRG